MKPFCDSQILVIGDVMLDRYFHGNTHRISPEAPVPIVHVHTETHRVGGAGNVAQNIKALQGDVTLLGLIGQDLPGKLLQEFLTQQDVRHRLLESETHPTITKLRVISQHQQMIRLDFEESFMDTDKTTLHQYYLQYLFCLPKLSSPDQPIHKNTVVILSDYQKGTLSDPQFLIQAARSKGVRVLVDPKGQNFTKYHGATLIKPNLKEFEAIAGPCPTDEILVQKAQEILLQLDLEALLITRGGEGMVLVQRNHPPYFLKAQSHDLVDVTGAGDTVIATLACALTSGYEYEGASYLANLAASIAVSKLGTATVSAHELLIAYHQKQESADNPHTKIISDRTLLQHHIEQAKREGKTIVMTNGCFDLLHRGHIEYLRKAKAQGDLLIVAINTDESISRLKGPGRPIAPLESRLHVLAALEMVDFAVPFHEDTPEALLTLLKPDVLVKGTDYTIDQIVGAPIVLGYGGKVERIAHDFQEISTSKLIQRASHPAS